MQNFPFLSFSGTPRVPGPLGSWIGHAERDPKPIARSDNDACHVCCRVLHLPTEPGGTSDQHQHAGLQQIRRTSNVEKSYIALDVGAD